MGTACPSSHNSPAKNIMDNKNAPPSSPSKPNLPWKTRLAVTLLSAITDRSRRPNGTVNRRLLKVLDFRTPPSPTIPIHNVLSSDITVDPTRNLWFRLFTPITTPAITSLPVLVFFHGGGFTFLSPDSKSYDAVCRKFSRLLQCVVVSINYRLAPEHRYPSQYDDGFDALQFLDVNPNILPDKADLSTCFIAGDSAGGNIAHHVTVRACKENFRTLRVIGLIPIQPFFGGEERTESEIRLSTSPIVTAERADWLWKVFLPEGADRDHPAANVSGPNAGDMSEIKKFPATAVVVGGFDSLQDWQRNYYEWLCKCGVEAELMEFPNMIHAFYVFPELADCSLFFNRVKDFVTRCSSVIKK